MSFWARIVLVFVVLVLVFTAVRVRMRFRVYGQGLRLSLRGSGARGQCRAHMCADTASGQGLRLSLRGPGAQRDCARWLRIRLFWQGLRLSLRDSCARVSRVFTCPLWCSTDARYRRAENCGGPQLQFVDQVETSLCDNRDRYAQCYGAFVSCMVGVS